MRTTRDRSAFFIGMLIMLATMSVALITNHGYSQSNHENSKTALQLKGIAIGVDHMDIQVFERNPSTCEWVLVKHKEDKRRYRVKLDPTKEYQIWFSNVYKGDKIIHVNETFIDEGLYTLDVDFNTMKSCLIYAEDDQLDLMALNDKNARYLVE